MDGNMKVSEMPANCRQAKADAQQTCLRGCAAASARRRSRDSWSSLRRIFLPAAVWAWAFLFTPLLWAAIPPQIMATEPTKSAVVTRITSEITVDGLLEEPAWEAAPTIELTQTDPRPGEEPTERTEVTLLYDADNLYIGVICYDAEPNRVIGTQMARDANLGSDDRILIVLDTYRDQRNAFYFATNPAGALVDGLVFANGQSNNDWDAIWAVRTRRTEEGGVRSLPFHSRA